MTPLLIVVSPTLSEARAAMADRVIRGEWSWCCSLTVAQRWLERIDTMGAKYSATIWVVSETREEAA
jgi:hypothetical protein